MDSDYKFNWADIGDYRSNFNSQLFLDCDLHQHLEDGTLGIPPAEPLVGDTTPNRKDVPYFIVGDDTFPLCNRLMQPYSCKDLSRSECLFNYRLSHTRSGRERVWDTNHWHCLLSCLQQHKATTTKIITSGFLLHNMMFTRYPEL